MIHVMVAVRRIHVNFVCFTISDRKKVSSSFVSSTSIWESVLSQIVFHSVKISSRVSLPVICNNTIGRNCKTTVSVSRSESKRDPTLYFAVSKNANVDFKTFIDISVILWRGNPKCSSIEWSSRSSISRRSCNSSSYSARSFPVKIMSPWSLRYV